MMNFYLARLSPDPAWLVLEGERKGSKHLGFYRVSVRGGVPLKLFDVEGFYLFSCTNKTANLCILGRPVPEKNGLAIFSFDPVNGTQKELTRIPLTPGSDAWLDYSWQISPDGSRIAILRRHTNEIQMFSLSGELKETVTVHGHRDLTDVYWATDSQSMFVASMAPDGASLLHVETTGASRQIWRQPQTTWIWGLPSPDDHHIAILGASCESSVWMIDGF
jgi:hypothetical protein